MHVVLVGDSIFDNRAYVGPGDPTVGEQVRAALPAGSGATLLAVDGDVTTDVTTQLGHVPKDATHVVVSVGGNDALGHMDVLTAAARSMAEALGMLAQIRGQFERNYRRMLDAVLRLGLPTMLCTIYYPSFPDDQMQRLTSTGLMVFNDVILLAAAERGVPLLDLRLLCDESADYANPIEPSAHGGAKIARVIAQMVTQHDFQSRYTTVYR